MRHLRYLAVALPGLLLSLVSCESVALYNADKFDQIDPACPYQPTALPHVTDRVGSLIALADGRALLVGGFVTALGPGQTLPPNDTEIYDPAHDTWTTVAPMGQYRTAPAGAAVPDGRVLVIGDDTYSTNIGRKVAEVYNPATNTWASIGIPGGGAYDAPAAVALRPPGNRVVVSSSIGLVLVDLDTGAGRSVGGVAGARGVGLCLMKDGNVFATYGTTWVVYSPSQDRIIHNGGLRYPRYFAGVATNTDGRVYICGGGNTPLITGNQAPVRGMEVYDPDSARLLRKRLPAELERETGYASRGCFAAAGRLLFNGTGGQDALLDLVSGKPVERSSFAGAPNMRPAPTQLSDGRLLHLGLITDLTKYPRP